MKLRVRHNTLRLRLGRSEIELLSQGNECREGIDFPGASRLEYVLAPSAGLEIGACFSGSTIRVSVPAPQLASWCSSDQVSLAGDVTLPGTVPLAILIEKDFRCLDTRVAEDQSDAFDNPLEMHPACDI